MKITLSKQKAKTWFQFSRYIRLRDCLLTTGTTTTGKCVSCLKITPFKQGHAGHFIPGRSGTNLFDELGVHFQCGVCNLWKKGNWAGYYEYMREHYGQDTIDELLKRNHQIKKYTVSELQELEEKYKAKAKELEG